MKKKQRSPGVQRAQQLLGAERMLVSARPRTRNGMWGQPSPSFCSSSCSDTKGGRRARAPSGTHTPSLSMTLKVSCHRLAPFTPFEMTPTTAVSICLTTSAPQIHVWRTPLTDKGSLHFLVYLEDRLLLFLFSNSRVFFIFN